ncbi:MAG: pyridoxine 5'-phosphate synthase [Calditrichia bacterium]|nr:pyridoxine 5'-phosphate synthase [Calditrichia bacterium]
MSRLGIDIDPVALIRNIFAEEIPDPTHLSVLGEMGGAESIVGFLREDIRSINERDVSVLKEIVKTHLNIRTTINDETVRKLLKIKPDMITFVSEDKEISILPTTVNLDEYAGTLSDYIADARANNIATSVFIEPNLQIIKQAGKLEFDYLEINAKLFTTAKDLDQQVAELESLNSMVIAANKLGMGVNISGGITQENIKELAKIHYLDDIIVSNSLMVKALAIGFEQAVRDFVSII